MAQVPGGDGFFLSLACGEVLQQSSIINNNNNSRLRIAAMSFGFGVGDFAGILQLSWTLYRYCYKVARDAPEDFKLLLGEITMLSQSIRLLEEEASDPDSTMVRAGEDRVRMVKEMIVRVEVTLKELQKHAAKYDKLGDVKLSKRKQIWSKFKWSTDATELDALRNKV